MAGSIDTKQAPAYPSPLWIIALFIALTEVTAGTAAITTDGTSRIIFTIFTVTFPLVVLGAFHWLLVNHPANLYGPWQYPKGVDVDAYAEALSRQRRTTSVVYHHAASEAVALASRQGVGAGGAAAEREDVEETLDRLVKESSIIVDCSDFRPGESAVIPVTHETTVTELLNAIYFELAPRVRPFTYGESWLLIDQAGRRQTGIGTQWAERRNLHSDLRRLDEVGIEPGSSLTAVRVDA